jgi:GTP cyclohydrolase I
VVLSVVRNTTGEAADLKQKILATISANVLRSTGVISFLAASQGCYRIDAVKHQNEDCGHHNTFRGHFRFFARFS